MLIGLNHRGLVTTHGKCESEEAFLATVVKGGIVPFAPPRTLRLVRGTSPESMASVFFHFKGEEIDIFKAY